MKKIFLTFLLLLMVNFVWLGATTTAQEHGDFTIKKEPRKVDIVLLQDESGSMKTTDPSGIRRQVANLLIDELGFAGEGNRMALVLYGTRAIKKVDLSRNFAAIKEAASQGFSKEITPKRKNYANFGSVPLKEYTDIRGAIEMAFQILEKSETGQDDTITKEKHVILLTDGQIDPWPGNADRYGNVADDFLDCLQQSSANQCHHTYRNRVAKIDTNALFDPTGILQKFKDKHWRIDCIGFAEADTSFLKKIASFTYGKCEVAPNNTQLLHVLRKIVPPIPNVVILQVKDFCKTRHFENIITNVGKDIEALQFKINLDKMLSKHEFIDKKNLVITITDPVGNSIKSTNDTNFKFYETDKGDLIFVSRQIDNPTDGTWRIRVDANADICGKMVLKGKVPFVPEMAFVPDRPEYYSNEPITLNLKLRNSNDPTDWVSIEKAEGKFRFTAHGENKGEEIIRPMSFTSDGKTAWAKLTPPPGIKGKATIETKIKEGRYGTIISHYEDIEIAGKRQELVVNIAPMGDDGKVLLGIIGDQNNRVEKTFELFPTTDSGSFMVNIHKPELEGTTGRKIPLSWIKVWPSSGRISADHPLKVTVAVTFPERAALSLPKGLYSGKFNVEPKDTRLSPQSKIPILQLDLEIPEIINEPSELVFDFKYMLSRPVTKTLRVRHTSSISREINVKLPDYLKGRNGEYEQDISVEAVDPDSLTLNVEPYDYQKIRILAKLANTSLHTSQRIPPGSYRGTISLHGKGMKSKTVSVIVKIPRKPIILLLRRVGIVLTALLFIMAIAGFIRFRMAGRRYLFQDSSLVIDKKGDMKGTDQNRFECNIQKTDRENLERGNMEYDLPYGGVNQDVKFIDSSSLEPKPIPPAGVQDIETQHVDEIHTPNYRHKVDYSSIDSCKLTVTKSPIGKKSGFLLKKVFIWLFLSGCAGLLTFWLYRIV